MPTLINRLLCQLFGHIPNEERDGCRRCGHIRDLCEWCSKRVATMYVHSGDRTELVCRPCTGVDLL